LGPEDQLKDQSIQAAVIPGETVRDQDKIQLVLAYLGILALIPLLTVKDSSYVQWHAKQGLVLGLGGGIALSILGAIPFVGLITCLAGPALLVVDILAMVKALNGERWRIPVVADLADKL
jgi:fumarate reductase subunit D